MRVSTQVSLTSLLFLPIAASFSAVTLPALLGGARARTMAVTCTATSVVTELKDELLDLLDEVTDRGIGAPAEVAEDILEVVSELDDMRAADDWDESPDLSGKWRLLYTSSRTFANNQGLSGYARDLAGVETPELYMSVETKLARRLVYEEPVVLQEGSIAALIGRFAGAKSIRVECAWDPKRDGTMLVTSKRVVVGDNVWEPADRQDKAVRALGAARPILLDRDVFILRSQPDYICWCFARA